MTKTIPPFHTLVLTNAVRRCLITTVQLSWECNSANGGLVSDEASNGQRLSQPEEVPNIPPFAECADEKVKDAFSGLE